MRTSNKKIVANFKQIRTKQEYALEKVARLADLSLNTIVKIESGVNQNPTIDTLIKVSQALEVEVNDLIK